MAEHLPDQTGIAQASPLIEQSQLQDETSTILDRLRNKGMAILATGLASTALIASPLAEGQPAYAANTEYAVIGMPFQGKWASSSPVNPGPNGSYNDSTSSHPSVHGNYSADWGIDVYARSGTEARLKVSRASGNASYSVSSVTNTSCGARKRVRVNVNVDGVNVGWVQYEHLDTNLTTGSALQANSVLGRTNPWGYLSCYRVSTSAGVHLHVGMKNTQSGYSCYARYSNPGITLNEGDNLGILGSPNNGPKQACSSIPTVGPETPPSPYPYQNITVTPNVHGGFSLFAASRNGLLGYKDQLSPGGDLQGRPWGGIAVNTKSQPEIVRHPNGALSVFTHGMDDRLYHAWQHGPGTAWSEDIAPGNITLRSEPSAVLNYTGGVSVFFPDVNGELRQIDQIGQGGDIGGMPIHNLRGNIKGKPAVISQAGRLAVFAQGVDGYLKTNFQLSQGGAWSGWLELGRGRKIKGDPKVLINRLGGMSVIAVGEGGDIVGIDQTEPNGDMNKPFYSLGKPAYDLVGTPAVVQTSHNEMMVFAKSAGGALYTKGQVQTNGYAWSGYFRLGGSFAGAPTAVINALGGASVFGRSPAGNVIALDQPGYGKAFNTTWAGLGAP